MELKWEISALSAAGEVRVRLSWDGGLAWTEIKTTPTLTTSDVVVTLGAPGDLWDGFGACLS